VHLPRPHGEKLERPERLLHMVGPLEVDIYTRFGNRGCLPHL